MNSPLVSMSALIWKLKMDSVSYVLTFQYRVGFSSIKSTKIIALPLKDAKNDSEFPQQCYYAH